LLRSAFPALKMLLAARPRQLPGALSNAVENLGPRGGHFVAVLTELAPRLATPDELLDAGAVVAWRLGDTRLRTSTLEIVGRLPTATLLAALGLADWPAEEAPRAIEELRADGWRVPLLPPSPPKPGRGEKAKAQPSGWHIVGRLGNFAGFD